MKIIVMDDKGKTLDALRDVVSLNVFDKNTGIVPLLADAGVYPSAKNVDAFVKALPSCSKFHVPDAAELQMTMRKCKKEHLFVKPEVIEKIPYPFVGKKELSLENVLQIHERIVYFALSDNYIHKLIYDDTQMGDDLIALMSTENGRKTIFNYTLSRLVQLKTCDGYIEHLTGLRHCGDDCVLKLDYGYGLPAEILWYDFNPRVSPCYAMKAEYNLFEPPLEGLFEHQDLKGTCLDGIVICRGSHPICGNLEDMEAFATLMPSLRKEMKEDRDAFTYKLQSLRDKFPSMMGGKKAVQKFETICNSWIESDTLDPMDAWDRTYPATVQDALEFIYGMPFKYQIVESRSECAWMSSHYSSQQTVFYKSDLFSDSVINDIVSQYYDDGDTYIIVYNKPSDEMLSVDNQHKADFLYNTLYDTVYVCSSSPEKAKASIANMLNTDVTIVE